MHSVDLTVLRWFNGLAGHSHGFDAAVVLFTNAAPIVLAALLVLYFFLPSAQMREMRRVVVLAGIAGVVALAVNAVIGLVIYRARPFVVLPPEQLHLLTAHKPDSSFPSDHAVGSAAFATAMWWAPGKSARWIFAGLALLVGLSRLVVGVHWPSDVLASFILGGLWAGAVFALARPLSPALNWALHLEESVEAHLRRQLGSHGQ